MADKKSVGAKATPKSGVIKKKKTEVAHKSTNRFLEVELNGAGVIVGIDSYEQLKGQPNYIGDFKKIFPEMELLTGTSDSDNSSSFTLTTTPLPVFSEGMAAILFDKAELDTLNTEDDFNKLANPDLVETINITAIDGETKKVALERPPLNLAFKNMVILENNGFIQLAQLMNFDVNESQDEVETNTQTSGGYKSSLGGLKSSAIEGVTGLYDSSIPSVAVLSSAYNNESTIRARHGAMKVKFAPYIIGVYKVTEFTTKGETSGNGRLEYQAALKLPSGQIDKKTFI